MTRIVVAHVTVPCAPHPNQKTHTTHRIDIHADGSVTTPDHDNEPWAGSNLVERALGGNFTWTPCDWWQAVSLPEAIEHRLDKPFRTEQERQHPYFTTNFTGSGLTSEGWETNRLTGWTAAAHYTEKVAYGLIPAHEPQTLANIKPDSLLSRALEEMTVGLRDPEAILAAPETLQVPARREQVYAVGVRMLKAVQANNTPDRWQAASIPLAMIARSQHGTASIALAQEWMTLDPDPETEPPIELLYSLLPLLQEHGIMPKQDPDSDPDNPDAEDRHTP